MRQPKLRDDKSSKFTSEKSSQKGILAVGKPPHDEERPVLRSITFKADDETLDALDMLEDKLDQSVRARRSVAIRGAILDRAADLKRALDPSQPSRKHS